MVLHLTLIGAEHSYFTGKVRGYLRWKKVPFTEVVSTLEVYASTILPHVGWPVIPVLKIAEGSGTGAAARYVQDTSDIIDEVERLFPGLPAVRPAAPCLRVLCALVELLADCWLLLPAMHYRWNFPEQRAFLRDAFASVTGDALADSAMAKFGGAPGRAGAKEFVGAAESVGPAVERSFLQLLDLLQLHLGGGRLFLLGGTEPTLADFAMMGPFYAHLFRDPVPGARMKMRAPRVAAWVERVMGLSGCAAAAAVPLGTCATLEAVVGHMLSEYMPVLSATAALFAEQHFADGASVPRAIGMVPFSLGPEGTRGTRAAVPFDLWMAQRVFDELHDCGGASGAEYLRGAFGEAGAALLELAPGFAPDGNLRVKREQNVVLKGYRDPATPYSAFEGGRIKPSKL